MSGTIINQDHSPIVRSVCPTGIVGSIFTAAGPSGPPGVFVPRFFGGALLRAALLACAVYGPNRAPAAAGEPTTIQVGDRDIRATIRRAPPHAIIVFDRNRTLTVSAPLVIDKPLTIRGINAKLADGLARIPIIIVESPGFRLEDFELRGNASNVPSDDRSPLVTIRAGDFAVQRGVFINSAKDGVMIQGVATDIVGGIVRDVTGVGNVRDVVSIAGGKQAAKIRNVLVENVRAYGSILRGAVEVSDGMDNVTVRKVFARDCVYAVDVQDHGHPRQDNHNVVLEDIYAVDSRHAIRTKNSVQGHTNLTIRDLTAERCEMPLRISNTDNVFISGVRVLAHVFPAPPITVSNCNGVSIRDVAVEIRSEAEAALLLVDCNRSLIDGLVLNGDPQSLGSALTYRETRGDALEGLRIHNVFAPRVNGAGIRLSSVKEGGTLVNYIITGNVARIENTFPGSNGLIRNNLGTP